MYRGSDTGARPARVVTCEKGLELGVKAMGYLACVLCNLHVSPGRDEGLHNVVSNLIFDC